MSPTEPHPQPTTAPSRQRTLSQSLPWPLPLSQKRARQVNLGTATPDADARPLRCTRLTRPQYREYHDADPHLSHHGTRYPGKDAGRRPHAEEENHGPVQRRPRPRTRPVGGYSHHG